MIKPMTRAEQAAYILRQNGRKMTAKEIAEQIAVVFADDEALRKKRESLAAQSKPLIGQLASEISPAHLGRVAKQLGLAWEKPASGSIVYWTSVGDAPLNDLPVIASSQPNNDLVPLEGAATDKINPKKPNTKPNEKREHALYVPLMRYLKQEFGLSGLRIDEQRSSNKKGSGGNHWLHPDIVAMQVIGGSWVGDVKFCAEKAFAQKVRLWSFEVKVDIKIGNVRECFFQAVSNSSWANEGYLVAKTIASDAESELRMLSALHGIGVMVFNPDANERRILLPAKRKMEVDWQSVDRIADENRDFKQFLINIKYFYQTNSLATGKWDD